MCLVRSPLAPKDFFGPHSKSSGPPFLRISWKWGEKVFLSTWYDGKILQGLRDAIFPYPAENINNSNLVYYQWGKKLHNLLCYECLSKYLGQQHGRVWSSNNIALAITATVINMPFSFVIERMQKHDDSSSHILNYCPMFLVASKEFAYMILFTLKDTFNCNVDWQTLLHYQINVSVCNLCIAIDLTFFSIHA